MRTTQNTSFNLFLFSKKECIFVRRVDELMKSNSFQSLVDIGLRFWWGIIFLFWLQPSSAQVSYGLGLRTHVGGMQALKDVKGFYNDMRPWLSNEMGTSACMIGLEFGLEASFEKWGMAVVHIYGVGANAIAAGSNGGVDFRRKIKSRMWGIETVDVWYTPLKVGRSNIGGGIMPFGLGLYRVSTKVGDEEKVKVPLSDLEQLSTSGFIFKTSHVYAQFHLDLTRPNEGKESSFHLQFFYTWGPKRAYDLFYLNQEINPLTYPAHFQRTMMKINNFGFKLMYSI